MMVGTVPMVVVGRSPSVVVVVASVVVVVASVVVVVSSGRVSVVQ
jgi:hypothetical protein